MVKVSAILINVIPEPVDIPVPTGLTGAMNSANDTPPLVRQMTSEDDLSAEVVADSKCRDNVVRGPTSTPLKIAGLTVVPGQPCWRCHRLCGILGRPCWRRHRRCVDPGPTLLEMSPSVFRPRPTFLGMSPSVCRPQPTLHSWRNVGTMLCSLLTVL